MANQSKATDAKPPPSRDILQQPLTLPCGVVLKNRLAKAALTEGLADAANNATPAHQRLYARWARGGAGLVLTGNVQVDRRYLERPGNIVIEDRQGIEALHALAMAGTVQDTQLWMQISHAGRQTTGLVNTDPVGPSAVPLAMPRAFKGRFGTPRALTETEILDIVERFAVAATVARDAGFTGVEVHAAHGYLLSEFLSPRANVRTDRWGGSLENRARLLLEVIGAIRKAVGPSFPIGVKLNSSDFQKGGFSHADCLQVVAWLNEVGVDLLEISGGNYEQPVLMGFSGMEPVFEEQVRDSTRLREAYFLDYAARIRQVARMPVMVTGGFRSASAMTQALAQDDCQVIGMGRPFCVMPDIPQRLLANTLDQAPAPEKSLRYGPGFLGPNSTNDLLRLINNFSTQAWFCMQLIRMGQGQDPDPNMSLLGAMLRYERFERRCAKAVLQRFQQAG
jgi:2,4-dienoyl-CoA reductase-like NADH-dependent reductase (Old Yellow Enzyme family)